MKCTHFISLVHTSSTETIYVHVHMLSSEHISSVLVIYCMNNYIVYCRTVLWYVSVYLADVLSPQTVYSQVQ